MHRRLERQLKKSFSSLKDQEVAFTSLTSLFENEQQPKEFQQQFIDFIEKIDTSYKQYDRDLTLKSDSLRLSSAELIDLNNRVNQESEQQKTLIESIRVSVNRLLTGIGDEQLDADSLSAERVNQVLESIFDQLESAQVELQYQKEALDYHAIVTVCDKRGYLTYANSNFCEISGFSQKELIGLNQREIKANDDTREQYDAIWQEVNEGKVWHGELIERKKNGEGYWVATTIVPLLDKNGSINKFITIQTDLSPRKKVEFDLEKERRFLNSITDTMTEGVFTLDAKGHCTFFNQEAESISGYTKEEVLGKNIFSLFQVKDERGKYLSQLDHPLWQQFQLHKPYQSESLRFTAKNKLMFHASLSAVPMGETSADFTNSDIGIVGVFQNISQRIKIARDLSKAKEMAEQANQKKSEFLANMSHEIRTPLNAIIGLSHIAMGNATENNQRKQLQKIYRSGSALLAIVNEILDFSKIEAGQINLEKLDFNIDDIIEQLANVESHAAENKQIDFFITKDPNLPTLLIGDPLRISQILLNLTHNAIKFTSEGRVTVNFDFTLEKQDLIELIVNVSDTGIGMTAEQSSSLFQPFYQADASTTRKYGGTGLGLTISQRLTELMDGNIKVESTIDEGSTFTVSIPLPISQKETVQNQRAPLTGKKGVLILDRKDTTLLKSLQVYGLEVSQISLEKSLSNTTSNLDSADIVFLIFGEEHANRLSTLKRIVNKIGGKSLVLIDDELTPKDIQEVGDTQQVNLIYPPLNPSKLWDILNSLSNQEAVNIQRISNQENHNNQFKGYRVLLAEDNLINQEVAVAMMEPLGLEVIVANDGQDAIDKLNQNDDVDLVFMDVQMPNLDGYSATKEIRNQAKFKDLPIIALTAHALDDDRQKSLKAGMDSHITKPIDPDELFMTLNTYLSRHQKIRPRENTVTNEKALTRSENSFGMPNDMIGFDVETSISRIGGNTELYKKLLGQFVSDFSLTDINLSELLNEKDYDTAAKELHRFKGAAATLGAYQLEEASALLEEKCKDKNVNELDVTSFSKVLNGTLLMLLELKLISPSATTNSEENIPHKLNIEEIEKVAHDSLILLEEGNARALTQLDIWQSALKGTTYQETYALLYEQISNFEFKDAQKTIKDFLDAVHG